MQNRLGDAVWNTYVNIFVVLRCKLESLHELDNSESDNEMKWARNLHKSCTFILWITERCRPTFWPVIRWFRFLCRSKCWPTLFQRRSANFKRAFLFAPRIPALNIRCKSVKKVETRCTLTPASISKAKMLKLNYAEFTSPYCRHCSFLKI